MIEVQYPSFDPDLTTGLPDRRLLGLLGKRVEAKATRDMFIGLPCRASGHDMHEPKYTQLCSLVDYHGAICACGKFGIRPARIPKGK